MNLTDIDKQQIRKVFAVKIKEKQQHLSKINKHECETCDLKNSKVCAACIHNPKSRTQDFYVPKVSKKRLEKIWIKVNKEYRRRKEAQSNDS